MLPSQGMDPIAKLSLCFISTAALKEAEAKRHTPSKAKTKQLHHRPNSIEANCCAASVAAGKGEVDWPCKLRFPGCSDRTTMNLTSHFGSYVTLQRGNVFSLFIMI